MNYGVIVISRGRVERAQKTLPAWTATNLPVWIMTEPYEADEYRKAVSPLGVEVVAHKESDRGVGYARRSSVLLADSLGLDAYVMADDDTVVKEGDDPRKLLDFVMRGVAVNCGGWLGIHGKWYGHAHGKPDLVVPHFGDKAFATNVELALEAGNYDPIPWDLDTSEWNRTCQKAGYLWWVHSGVRIKEVGAMRAPGGIVSWFGDAEKRAASRREAHEYLYQKWGPGYVSPPGSPYRTEASRIIREFVGDHAVKALREMRAYKDDDPDIPWKGNAIVIYPQLF